MFKPSSFIIELKPYPFEVLFSINQSSKLFEKSLAELECEDFSDPGFYTDNCRARTVNLESGATIVRFKDLTKTSFGYGLIAHEIFHVVEFVFKRIGMPHNVKYSSEAYAYEIQYLTQEVFNQLGIK